MKFSAFMEQALYAPETGYYTRPRDPFGRGGDFFTAAQLQPVFGRLIAALAAEWKPSRILDWGGGRGEMRESLSAVAGYEVVEYGSAQPAPAADTLIFANELFDALPVDAARRNERGEWREMLAVQSEAGWRWSEGEPLEGTWAEYAAEAARWLPEDETWWLELPTGYGSVLEAMTAAAPAGWLLAIDYGYQLRELLRFPRGTLMSYRRHRAVDDVLVEPGRQDITAHVSWPLLEREAAARGWRRIRFESMASLLLRAGGRDEFASALAGDRQRNTAQLKTLLFGMGENFQAALFERP